MSNYRPCADTWFLARCKYADGTKRYGGYLGGFPERARVWLGALITDPVLHVCGGLAKQYPYKGGFGPYDKTLDLDADVYPDFLRDAREPFPTGFRAYLIDPPYSEEDAKQYSPGPENYPSPSLLVKNAMAGLPVGGRVGIIHYMLPMKPKNSKFVGVAGIISGFNNRIRAYSVFEKLELGAVDESAGLYPGEEEK